MLNERLFHVSSDPLIRFFEPRPSPSVFEKIMGPVVFAVSEKLLHNYLLPRDCPRVTFYAGAKSDPRDVDRFMGDTQAGYVMAVEKKWVPDIIGSTVYVYELPPEGFTLLDECAGYYISYEGVAPLSVTPVTDILGALLDRDLELRLLPSLWALADAIVRSSLNFSCIRMRNAGPR